MSGNRPVGNFLIPHRSHSRMCIRIKILISKNKQKNKNKNKKKAKETKEEKRISPENRFKK